MSNLRQQVIESQKSRSDFLKWKLILIAALGSAGLGLGGDNYFNKTYMILCLIPLVCVYVDALCIHLNLRIKIIGTFFRKYPNVDDIQSKYEKLLDDLNKGKNPPVFYIPISGEDPGILPVNFRKLIVWGSIIFKFIY